MEDIPDTVEGYEEAKVAEQNSSSREEDYWLLKLQKTFGCIYCIAMKRSTLRHFITQWTHPPFKGHCKKPLVFHCPCFKFIYSS